MILLEAKDEDKILTAIRQGLRTSLSRCENLGFGEFLSTLCTSKLLDLNLPSLDLKTMR